MKINDDSASSATEIEDESFGHEPEFGFASDFTQVFHPHRDCTETDILELWKLKYTFRNFMPELWL